MVGEIISPMQLSLPTHLLTSFKQMKQLNDRSCRCLGVWGWSWDLWQLKEPRNGRQLLQSVQHSAQWGMKLALQVARSVP